MAEWAPKDQTSYWFGQNTKKRKNEEIKKKKINHPKVLEDKQKQKIFEKASTFERRERHR